MRILAIFAHPDDESFGPAGTLAKASHQGHYVALLIFTRGESGTLCRSIYRSAEKLAEQRSCELQQASQKIGVQQLKVLNFPDNNLKNIPAEAGTNAVLHELRRFKPDTIITYHTNTISGHADHRAVTNWTFRAVKSLQNRPKLFYFGLDYEQTTMATFRKLIPIENGEVTHRINVENFIDDKIAAIQCHKTQLEAWHQFKKMKVDYKTFTKWEVFVQKWPRPVNRILKYDLFQ